MSESAFYSDQVKAALIGLHPTRVENPALPGTPDVNYCEGWIELKHADAWPVKADTIVKFDHFTPQQRVWILQRGRVGGRVHLLVKIGNDVMLFDWRAAVTTVFSGASKSKLLASAQRHWPNGRGFKKELKGELFKTDTTGRGLFD